MKKLRGNYLFAILLSTMFLIIICGCAPRFYLSSHSDQEFDFSKIKKVAIVLEKTDVSSESNLLFAKIFTQTARERKKFFLAQKEGYIPEEKISNQDLWKGADAFLKISLTHCHIGGYRSLAYSTSVGAYVRLVETGTGKMIWNTNYGYSSSRVGVFAPTAEEVMEIVAGKLIDTVPLKYTVPSPAASKKRETVILETTTIAPPPEEVRVYEIKEKSPTPFESSPYLIHVSSVSANKKYLDGSVIDKKTNDGTIRLATLVNLHSKGRWYRIFIGRFKSLDACQSYIQRSRQSGKVGAHARPVKLPFSLLVSSGQTLVSSQRTASDLREKHFMAYLSPTSTGAAGTYDVLIGAYTTKTEAARKAKILLQKGISTRIVSP